MLVKALQGSLWGTGGNCTNPGPYILRKVSARAYLLLSQGWVESSVEFKLTSYGNLFIEFIKII